MCGPSSGKTRAGSSVTVRSSCGTPGIAEKRKSCSPREYHWGSRPCALGRGILTNGAEVGIDGNWERGRVWFKRLITEERVITIYRRANSSSSELVYAGELIHGWDEDFEALWIEAMDDAHLRESETTAATRGARLHLLSWNVACAAAGPPTTKKGARSKQAKEFESVLRDLGRDHCWSIPCVQKITSSNGELVTETTVGHHVFATPPCPGQRRLAIVVSAAFTDVL